MSQYAVFPLEDESCSVSVLQDPADEPEIEAGKPRFVAALTLTFPPAFAITSPSSYWGEAMVKADGRTLLSTRSRACLLISHPQILRKSPFFSQFALRNHLLDVFVVTGIVKTATISEHQNAIRFLDCNRQFARHA